MRDYDFYISLSEDLGPFSKDGGGCITFLEVGVLLKYFSHKSFEWTGWACEAPKSYLLPREFYRPEELNNNGKE